MRRACLLLACAASWLAATACDSDDGDSLANERAEQVRAAALDAGLEEDIADLLSLAARGATATFQISYAGRDGASLVVSQDPPNRRVDVLQAGLVVQSQVVRDGVGYRCAVPDDGQPGDDVECTRTSGALEAPGAFTEDALRTFADELAGSLDDLELTVEDRTIAGTDATCLVSAPRAGTPLDPDGPGVDTVCLSPEGAQLLVDSGGERAVADGYSTDVPDGTFDV